jgi:hypothetical protein
MAAWTFESEMPGMLASTGAVDGVEVVAATGAVDEPKFRDKVKGRSVPKAATSFGSTVLAFGVNVSSFTGSCLTAFWTVLSTAAAICFAASLTIAGSMTNATPGRSPMTIPVFSRPPFAILDCCTLIAASILAMDARGFEKPPTSLELATLPLS